ncbi:MAG: N-6 DNA methylase [Chloroflexota bacterium]|nr:N-6 DNA methylase [Chloroflexota bacterium]
MSESITRETARADIASLVAKYVATPKKTRDAYSEQQTREYFILPLFRALGWDTQNPSEFSAEESIAGKFADFGFYLGGIPIFYLETKRVRVELDNDALKQAISYAYNRGITWAVLTNFDQLVVLNAEWDVNDLSGARFLTLGHADYAESGFDDLWLLSKPAMQTTPRPVDLRAERYGKKTRRAPVTEQLFKNLSAWRDDLFRSIYFMQDTLWATDAGRVDNAVQKLIDRLIFIRSMEDRGIEAPLLQPLVRQHKAAAIYPNLLKLFRQLDGTYNSNLFAAGDIDLFTLHDPGLVTEIIDGLYAVQKGFVRYQFDAIKADVLGAVYEQYLAYKAQDADGKKALDTRKTIKRKSQGIYYTPQYIVRYIVRATVGRALAAGADARTLRILDPACGSGSFLIEAFDVLDKHFERLEPHIPAAERRQRIVRENLYGVDLDDQAVEVTRLNLALRAAVDRRKLPMLAHIQRGNSLVDDPAVAGDAAFKWDERFPEVMDAGGFDVVIGNPPYGAEILSSSLDYFKHNYGEHAGTFDTYELFLSKSKGLLTSQGNLGMIIPSSWLSGERFVPSRRALVDELTPSVILALPFDVFKSAYVDTAIVVFSREKQQDATCTIHYFPKKEILEKIPDKIGVQVSVAQIRSDRDCRLITIYAQENQPLWLKLQSDKSKLGDYFNIQRGVQPYSRSKHSEAEIKQRFLHATKPISPNHMPELQGSELSRYFISPNRASYLEYSDRIASTRPKSLFEGARIVLRRLLTRKFRLQASFTDETLITTDNVLNIVPKSKDTNPLYYLGILNSTLMSWFYVNTSLVAQKDDFPQVHISALKNLPLPTSEKARHDRIVERVTRLIALNARHADAATPPSEREALTDQIAALDRTIDADVYALYGLTDDEIALVTG